MAIKDRPYICAVVTKRKKIVKVFQMENSDIQGNMEDLMGSIGEFDYYLEHFTGKELREHCQKGVHVVPFFVMKGIDKDRFIL